MKKGFTLIEMLGVIVLLGVIALITVPTINIVVKNSEKTALNQTITTLETAAYSYSDSNSLGYSSKTQILEIETLKETGFIKNETIIDPTTDEELTGCIFYRWDDNHKQYKFNYSKDCELKELNVEITNISGEFNDLGWANKDFFVNIKTNGLSYSYCVSDKKCNPKAVVNSSEGSAYVTTESESIYVCAYAMDGDIASEVVCSEKFKLDKTLPVEGSVEIFGTQGENGWYTSDVEIKVTDGTDELSGHKETVIDKNIISNDTKEETVTVTTKDNADNVINKNHIIKIDKTKTIVKPTITANDNITSNNWHKSQFILTFNTTSNPVSGITYYYGTNANDLTSKGNSVTVAANTTGITYYVKACNGAGVCSDVSSYVAKLDTSSVAKPSITANDNIASGLWHSNNVTLTFSSSSASTSTSGVTYYYGTSSNNITNKGVSVTVSTNSATENGETYYVKACNEAGTCSEVATYVLKIDKSSMSAPSITASDGKASSTWHTSDFTLTFKTTSTPVSGITYYYGTSENSLTSTGGSVTVNTNVEAKTYYVKACNGAGTCSNVSSYVAKLDKVTPSITISKTVVDNKNVLTATLAETSVSKYSYVWYKDGSVISGATSASYTTSTSGTYKVKVTTGAGLSATSSDYVINSYTIIYNMNGGTGSIANQTKIQDLTLTLSTTKPEREGYEFLGWSTSQTATSAEFVSGGSLTTNGDKTLYAVWKSLYDGVPDVSYKVGDIVTYQGIDFLVVKDNGDTVTLVTKSNVGTGAYGSSTTFAGSTASTFLNTTWVNSNSKLSKEISSGAVVKDSTTNSYVRLLTKSELSTSLPNASGTNFWTLTANGSSVYYGLPDGSSTYTKYSVSANSQGTCYSGSSTDLSAVSSSYNKNTLSNSTVTASAAPSATSAVTSTSYALSASGSCLASYSTSKKTVAETCNCTGTNCSNTYECTKTSTFNTTLTTSTQVLGSSCTGYNCTKYNTNYSTTKTSTISTPYTTSSWCTTTSTRTTNTNYYKTTSLTSSQIYYTVQTTSTSYLKSYPLTGYNYYSYSYVNGYDYYKTTSLTGTGYGYTTKTTSTKYYYATNITSTKYYYGTSTTSTKYYSGSGITSYGYYLGTSTTSTKYYYATKTTSTQWTTSTKTTSTSTSKKYLLSTSYYCAACNTGQFEYPDSCSGGKLSGTNCIETYYYSDSGDCRDDYGATCPNTSYFVTTSGAKSSIKTTSTSNVKYYYKHRSTYVYNYYKTTSVTSTRYYLGTGTTSTKTYWGTSRTSTQYYLGTGVTDYDYYYDYPVTSTGYYKTTSVNATYHYYTTKTTSTKTYYATSTTSTQNLYGTTTTSTSYLKTTYPTSTGYWYTTKTTSTKHDLTSGCNGSTTVTYSQAANTSYYSTPTTTTCAGSTCNGYSTSYNYLKTTKQTSTPYQTTCGTQSTTCSTCDTCDVEYTVYTASGADASWSRYVVSEQTNALGYRAVITVMKK